MLLFCGALGTMRHRNVKHLIIGGRAHDISVAHGDICATEMLISMAHMCTCATEKGNMASFPPIGGGAHDVSVAHLSACVTENAYSVAHGRRMRQYLWRTLEHAPLINFCGASLIWCATYMVSAYS